MVKIIIPEKTFQMYLYGQRTFIHLRKDDPQIEELRKLKFGEEVLLVAKDTKREMKQTFWFLYDMKEIERFVFLVFRTSIQGDPIFFERNKVARSNYRAAGNEYFLSERYSFFSNFDQLWFSRLASRSALMFIFTEYKVYENTLITFLNEKNKRDSEHYITLNVLTLRQFEEDWEGRKEDEGIVWVASLIPARYLYL